MSRVPSLLSGLVLVSGLCLGVAASGCDFFRELESENETEGTTGGEDDSTDGAATAGDTGDGTCTFVDDFCPSQDVLQSCTESGEIVTTNCAQSCAAGGTINFSCLDLGNLQHACWCVIPGANKIDSCSQVESCLSRCTLGNAESCGQACFSRTDLSTVRLLGDLFHCAESACQSTCDEDPAVCSDCIATARAGLFGGCGTARALCDTDTNDENPWGF